MATKNIGQYSSPTLPLADDDLIAGAQINASGQGTDVKIKKKDLLLGMLGFAGTYAANVTYALGNVVYYSGSGYVCVATSVIGVIPGTNSAKWAILVSKGDAGALTAEYEAILNQAIATWNGAVDTTTQNVATATAQANVATNSANVAATSAASLQAALASFRAVYIGSLPSDPSADGNGNPLVEGAEYYNTTENKLRIWNGSAWVDYDSSVQTLTQNATLSAAAAANSATQAVNAAADVASAESNVTNLANQTQTNADSAANSATTATAAATSAANSATAASGSAADAAAVVTTVQAAASDAAASASNADASATTASNNAAAASASALSAAGSATSASNSASTASAAASSVGDSATQAAASATAAANSASDAATAASTISQFRTVYNLSAAAAGQSTYSVSGGYLIGLIDVYLNGFHLTNTVHYDALDGSNVVLKGSDVLATVTAGSQISISALTTYAVANAVPISSLAGSAGAGMVGFTYPGSPYSSRNLVSKLGEVPSPEDFGAVGDGTTNDTAAIQLALNTCGSVRLSGSKIYYLATPLQISSGMAIYGPNARLSGFYTKGMGILKPATCAIQTSDYSLQQTGFTLRQVGIIGGTLQVDMGLFHDVTIEDCEFYHPSIGGLMITRGEKQSLRRLRFDAGTTNIFGMAIGRWQESLNPGTTVVYSDSYFGTPGSWSDRMTIDNITFQGGPSATFTYGILSNILGGAGISNIVFHGNAGAGGEIACIYARDRVQNCTISNIAPDSCGNASNPMPSMFYFGQLLNSVIMNVHPQFAGNNVYVRGFDIELMNLSTLINCRSDGDNTTTYGFYFPNSVGQIGTLINCRGSFYHASTGVLIRGQINQIECSFTGGNNGYSGNSTQLNQDILDLIMADTSGSTAVTARWGAMFASGSGNNVVPFYARKEGAWIANNTQLLFANSFGETYPQSVRVGSVLPNGNVTANPGSIYMYYVSNTSGKAYIKESGSAATGWKPINGLSATTAWTPGAVAASAIVSTTVTVTGAVMGDQVTVGFTNALSGIILYGEVTAADTVTVRMFNPTGASITPTAGNVTARVFNT